MKTLKIMNIKTLLLSVAFLLMGTAFTACEKDKTTPKEENNSGNTVTIGSVAPEFTLEDTDGKQVKLSQFKGKVVTLFFFGNGCSSCKGIAPRVQKEIVESFDTKKSQVLAIDQWNGNLSAVKAFMSSTGLTTTTLQQGAELSKTYNTSYDRIIIIDNKGVVRFIGKSNVSQDIDAIKAAVKKYTDMITDDEDPKDDPKDDPTVKIAPAFDLTDTDGNQVKLADSKGKVTVLFFFGNGCPSCKGAAPNIQSSIVEAFDVSKVQVLALDQWDGNLASVKAFKTGTGLDVPTLLNASNTAKAYNMPFDRLVVIDKEGNIRFKGSKNASSDLAAAKDVITKYAAM